MTFDTEPLRAAEYEIPDHPWDGSNTPRSTNSSYNTPARSYRDRSSPLDHQLYTRSRSRSPDRVDRDRDADTPFNGTLSYDDNMAGGRTGINSNNWRATAAAPNSSDAQHAHASASSAEGSQTNNFVPTTRRTTYTADPILKAEHGQPPWELSSNHQTASPPQSADAPRYHHTGERNLPKYFKVPLTCHFWAQGSCNKTADECWYAHHDTGLQAAAPVKVGGRIVAGRTAHDEVMLATVRTGALDEREAWNRRWEDDLRAHEKELKQRKIKLDQQQNDIKRQLANIERERAAIRRAEQDGQRTRTELHYIVRAVDDMSEQAHQCRNALERRRDQLYDGRYRDDTAMRAMDNAVDAVNTFMRRVIRIKDELPRER